MNEPLILAIDGGNSKTDLALVQGDGSLVAFVRGPLSSPHHLGVDGCLDVLTDLLDRACAQAGLVRTQGPVAEVAELLLAGLDFPAEEKTFRSRIDGHGWARQTIVGNDTFALLRAGTARGWGVAVVCGAGINCVGVAPDGRHARFAALGATTGDWGGGFDVGLAALSAAARSEDGRGPVTTLEHKIPAYFDLQRPLELAEALHLKQIPMHRLVELSPIVLAEAEEDAVAGAIVDRLAGEVVAFARVALTRLELTEQPVEVILGGGVLRSGNRRLLAGIEAGLGELGPQITLCVSASSPIVGAALLALDELGAAPAAQERVRHELSAAVSAYDLKSRSHEESRQINMSLGRKRDG
jgi:N-acetylglucosamine kinase-like BadF-type ATPase